MATTGTMRIAVVGDASKFNRAMGSAQSKLSKLGGAAKKVGKFAAVGLGAAGAAAVTGAFKVASFGDEVAKSAQKAGIAVEPFQELRFAFGQGGVEAKTMDTALMKFNKRLGESATSGGTADEAFERLNIALRDADGNVRDATGALDEALPKLAAIESDAERAALAGDLFGQRAGPELAAALSDGIEGIDEARQKAQDLGIVMSEDSAKAAEKFTDQWDDIRQSTLGLLRTGLTPVMEFMSSKLFPFVQRTAIPALRKLGEWFSDKVASAIEVARDIAEDLRKRWDEAFPAIERVARDFGNTVARVFDFLAGKKELLIGVAVTVGGALVAAFGAWAVSAAAAAAATVAAVAPVLAIGAAIAALVGGIIWAYNNFETFRDVVDKVVGWFADTAWPAVKDVADFLIAKFGEFRDWVQKVWPDIQEAITHVINVVSGVIGRFVDAVGTAWRLWGDEILGIAQTIWGLIESTVQNAIRFVQGIIETVLAIINGDWGKAWDAIKDVFGAVWAQIKDILGATLGILKDLLSIALDTITGVWSDAWDGVKRLASGALDAVVGFVRDLPGKAVDALREGATALVNAGKWLINQVWDGIKAIAEAADGLFSWFTGIPGRVAEGLANLAGTLFDAGKELMQNIIDGVKSLGGSLIDTITSPVTDAVSNLPVIGRGDGPGMAVPDVSGKALDRVRAATEGLPVRITSTYRTPAENAAVGGSPTSYHMDRSNPAVDIGGPSWALDLLHARLAQMGDWRELLWRTRGHFDHVHVAHEGGTVTPQGIRPLRADELMARLQVGETVVPRNVGGGRGQQRPVINITMHVAGHVLSNQDLVDFVHHGLVEKLRRNPSLELE